MCLQTRVCGIQVNNSHSEMEWIHSASARSYGPLTLYSGGHSLFPTKWVRYEQWGVPLLVPYWTSRRQWEGGHCLFHAHIEMSRLWQPCRWHARLSQSCENLACRQYFRSQPPNNLVMTLSAFIQPCSDIVPSDIIIQPCSDIVCSDNIIQPCSDFVPLDNYTCNLVVTLCL